MQCSEAASLHMFLPLVENNDIVLTVDNAADTVETLRGISTNDLDTMSFKDILYIANGIESQIPVLSSTIGQRTHLVGTGQGFSFHSWSGSLVLTQDLFYFQISLHLILNLNL